MGSSDGAHQQQQQQPHTYNIEEILRQNEEVWQAYQSGRFDLQTSLQDLAHSKKIVLRERPSSACSGDSDSGYTVRKYRVTIHRSNNKSDEHLLLVSFCNNNNNNNNNNGGFQQQQQFQVNAQSMAATVFLPQQQQVQQQQQQVVQQAPEPQQPLSGKKSLLLTS
jgi:hypothetical protein